MLHILLTVMSVTGIILLVLLGITVFLILALLFVPVCYRGHLVKQGERIQAGAKVSWLFRLVYVRIRYENGKPSVKIYLFGIPVLKVKQYLNRKKEKKQAASAGKTSRKGPSVPPGGQPFQKGKQDFPKILLEPEQKVLKKESPVSAFFRKIREIPRKIRRTAEKIWFTIRRNCAKIREWYGFFTSLTFKRAWKTVKRRGTVILRHILPKKVRGYVRFGFSDPAATGQAIGAVGMFLPLIPEGLRVIPDFQEPCLEADVNLKGRIVLFVLLRHGLAIYRDKYVQRVIKNFSIRRHSNVREEQ